MTDFEYNLIYNIADVIFDIFNQRIDGKAPFSTEDIRQACKTKHEQNLSKYLKTIYLITESNLVHDIIERFGKNEVNI